MVMSWVLEIGTTEVEAWKGAFRWVVVHQKVVVTTRLAPGLTREELGLRVDKRHNEERISVNILQSCHLGRLVGASLIYHHLLILSSIRQFVKKIP